jgi:hypothetical protein
VGESGEGRGEDKEVKGTDEVEGGGGGGGGRGWSGGDWSRFGMKSQGVSLVVDPFDSTDIGRRQRRQTWRSGPVGRIVR